MRIVKKIPDLLPPVLAYLEDALPSYHFAGDLTGWHAPEVWITIQPTGGLLSRVRTGTANLDFSVYAPSKPAAFAVAANVIKALHEMFNLSFDDGVITGVECTYPADIPDPINSNPRYMFDVRLSFRTN